MIFNLVPLHQVYAQALFCMRFHLSQYITRITIVEVVRPPTKAGIYTPDYIFQWYRCVFPCCQLCYTVFDSRKRFRRRADMRIIFARLQSLTHPDFKPQEVETFLFGIDNVCFSLISEQSNLLTN